MKKIKLKLFIHLLICILVSFVCIYLSVFFVGWKLLESGYIIQLEIAISVVVGIIIFLIYEIACAHKSELDNLQQQIDKLHEQIEKLNKSK